MARFLKNRESLVGKAPGAMTFIGRQKMEQPRFRIMVYDETGFEEFEVENANDLLTHVRTDKANWINIDGVHDQQVILEIGKAFDLSPLVLEDIVNTDQRPKLIEEDDAIIIFLRQLSYSKEDQSIHADQITLVMGAHYVISFQEKVGSFFDPIRQRLRQNTGKIRSGSCDYLFYRMIDTIVDNYMFCIGVIGELVEANEENILSQVKQDIVEQIYAHKTEISYIRKAVRPAKEVSKKLRYSHSDLLSDKIEPYINDLDDLLVHALETVEVYYTMITDQLNIYNTNLNNRANDVMKVLTIFAAIFIPLTFIAGVYGTNFDNIPELHFRYSYFIMLGLMLVVALIMLFFFRKKKWF